MKEKQNNNYLIFLNILVVVYLLYICLSIVQKKAILTDDLAIIYESGFISDSYFSYIYSFLDSVTMAARPVSGLVMGTLSFLSKGSESVYLLGILFFPLSILILYWVAQKILTKELASLIALLYSCSMIGTSIQFSSIMLNSNLATIFFAISIYYAYIRQNSIASSLFFIASVLSYEIFLPLLLLNVFLIKDNKKRILFAIFTTGLIILFRKVIQPNLFVNSYQRDEINKIFELTRVLQVAVYSLKMFFKDLFVGIYKGLLNIRKMNAVEIAGSLIIPMLVYKVFSRYDFKNKKQEFKRLTIISFVSIVLGLSIFLFSSYIPTLFGFDNRNLGAIRLFHTLFIISGVIYLSVKLKLENKTISACLAGITFLFVVTDISVKNSWIYASELNNELFTKLDAALKDNNIESGNICLEYDVFNELKNNSGFTLREPIFYNDWEGAMLCKINGINPEKIHVYNIGNKTNCEVRFQYKNGKMILLNRHLFKLFSHKRLKPAFL